MTAEIRIGTSGWQYAGWRGRFYPRELPVERWLEHYVATFDTVELNASFYRLQSATTYVAWRRRLPDTFRMSVKASRYLTHVKRLREPKEPLERIWSRARRLGVCLGPVLYQLPPRWHRNVERLEEFAALIPPDHPQAIEFRDPTWYHPDVDALLRRRGLARCVHDMHGSASPTTAVGPFVYLRFHGSGVTYGGSYSGQALSAWADRVLDWAEAGLPVWAYFNNDARSATRCDCAR
jgi:uncharacterized protein YecE (DUF72 family)